MPQHLDLRRAKDEAREFDSAFWSGEPLDAVFDRIGNTEQSQRTLASADEATVAA